MMQHNHWLEAYRRERNEKLRLRKELADARQAASLLGLLCLFFGLLLIVVVAFCLS